MPWRFKDSHTTVKLQFGPDFADKETENNPFNSFTELQTEEEIVHGTPHDQTHNVKSFDFAHHQSEDNLSEARSEGSVSTDYDSVIFLTCVTFSGGTVDGDYLHENSRCYILCVNQSGIIRTWDAKTNNSIKTIHLHRFPSSNSSLKYQVDWANGVRQSPNEKVVVIFRLRRGEIIERVSHNDNIEDCRTDFVRINCDGTLHVNEDTGSWARNIIRSHTNFSSSVQRAKHFPQFMLIIDCPSVLNTTYMIIFTKTTMICIDIVNFTYEEKKGEVYGNIKECIALYNKDDIHVHVLRQLDGIYGLHEVFLSVKNKYLRFSGDSNKLLEQSDMIKIKKMENAVDALLVLTNKLIMKQVALKSALVETGSIDLSGCHKDYGITQKMIYKPVTSEDKKTDRFQDRIGLLFLLFEKPIFFVVEVIKKGEQLSFGKKRVFDVFKKKTFRIRALGTLPVDNCLWLVVKGDRGGLFHIMMIGLPGEMDLLYDGTAKEFIMRGTVPSCYKGLKCDPIDLRENGFVVGDYRGRIVHVKDTRKIFHLNLEIFKKVMCGN